MQRRQPVLERRDRQDAQVLAAAERRQRRCVSRLRGDDRHTHLGNAGLHARQRLLHPRHGCEGQQDNVLWGIVHPVLDQTTVAGCTLCSRITTQTAMVDEGYLTYPGETDTWFGAIQPDREGNLFIGFDFQSETLLLGGFPVTPSSAYVSRRATAAAGSGFPDGGFFLQASTDPTDDFRWGDYSAIGFDGWESNGVWFATEYSGANNDWATHIDELGYTSLDTK